MDLWEFFWFLFLFFVVVLKLVFFLWLFIMLFSVILFIVLKVFIGFVNVYKVKMIKSMSVGLVVIMMNIRRIINKFIKGILLC